MQVLRWSCFREQKGAIYALALSPDSEHVAIGGAGARVGAAAVLNRSTGDVEFGLIDRQGENFAIWSIAFSPSGKRVAAGKGDGSIALWDLEKPKHREGNRIDETYRFKHAGEQGFNAVRLVSFATENELVSVAEKGEVIRWNLGDKVRRRQQSLGFRVEKYLSGRPDRRWEMDRRRQSEHASSPSKSWRRRQPRPVEKDRPRRRRSAALPGL